MNPIEFVCVVLLILLLLGLAGYFAWRQFQTLYTLKTARGLPADETHYARRQAFRRLFCSGLMVILAGFLFGWFFVESNYREMMRQVEARDVEDRAVGRTEEEKQFVREFWAYVAAGMLVLFILLLVAAVDAFAIARFGLEQHRKLQASHRAMLDDFTSQHRSQRNGFH